MWRQNNLLVCLFGLIFISCGFTDLRSININIQPDNPNTILQDEYSPVIIGFDTAMDRSSVEKSLQVIYSGGSVDGDFTWNDNSLAFIPTAGWTAGTRYSLSLSGTIYSLDGRELRVNQYIPFYAINRAPAPLVNNFYPPDGASIGTGDNENYIVELHFSVPMQRLSAESAFTINASGEKNFIWLDDDKILQVYSEKKLSPWTVYRWSLTGKALSREGVPLAKALSAQFTTDEDRIFPSVLRSYPVLQSNGVWIPIGPNLDEIGPSSGHGIGITFTKAMGENVLRSIRFEPSLSGRTEQLSEKSFVFIPSKDPEPETVYTLIVAGDAADIAGLKMGKDYRINFTADIPFLHILSFADDSLSTFDDPSDGDILHIPVDVPGGGVFRLTIRFSLPFSIEAKQETAFKISLEPFFPGTLSPVALRFVTWLSDDLLRMEWEGIQGSVTNEDHYYRLKFPGGKAGINNGSDMYMKSDKYFYLEAVK